MKKQLKQIKNDLDDCNANSFKKSRFLNQQGTDTKVLDKIKELNNDITYEKIVLRARKWKDLLF